MASLPDHLGPAPVGRERLPKVVVAQHQRSRILDAALSVFADQGYPATTVDDIVGAAEVGVGSFYSVFDGKEECLLALYDEGVAEAGGALLEAMSSHSAWEEKVCDGLRRTLRIVADDPQRARVLLIEIQTAGRPALARYQETLDQVARGLSGGRAKTKAPRKLPPTLEVSLVNCVAWLLHRKVSLGEADSAPELFSDLAELVLEPYVGEDSAGNLIASQVAR